jgi:hypothetical protein
MDSFRPIAEVHDIATPATDMPVNNQEEPTQPLNLCVIA